MAQDPPPIQSEKEKLSYSIGAKVGEYFDDSRRLINVEMLVRGIRDALGRKGLSMEKEEIEKIFAEFEQVRSANRKVKEAGDAFLAENAKAEGILVLQSGVQYKILKRGSGQSPTSRDRIKAHYRITLVDGTVFYTSYEDDTPGDIGVNQVVPGLEEALKLMSVGSKWQVFIPSDLAYGVRGVGAKVPPHSALIVEMEIFEVEEVKVVIL
jgi:FKBP-type peptidyl-prolyl cis-trans isomerase FklB